MLFRVEALFPEVSDGSIVFQVQIGLRMVDLVMDQQIVHHGGDDDRNAAVFPFRIHAHKAQIDHFCVIGSLQDPDDAGRRQFAAGLLNSF